MSSVEGVGRVGAASLLMLLFFKVREREIGVYHFCSLMPVINVLEGEIMQRTISLFLS